MAAAQTFPLTTVERRFWLAHELYRGAQIANIGRIVRVRGADVGAFATSLRAAFSHPHLRLRLGNDVDSDGTPRAFLADAAPVDVVDDLCDDTAVDSALDDIVHAPYGLVGDALVRARILRTGDDEHTLVIGAHHLLLDGWALSALVPRFLGDNALPSDAAYLADRGSRDVVDDTVRDRDRQYWRDALAGASPLPLPAVTSRSRRRTDLELNRPPVEQTALSTWAARPFDAGKSIHALLAAYAIELARACRTDDLVMGTTSHARSDAHKDALGCFVRTRMLRAILDKDATFDDVTRTMRAAVKRSLAHPGVDAEDGASVDAPALAAVFNYITKPAFDLPPWLGEVMSARRVSPRYTTFPLALTVDTVEGEIVVEAAADLFDDGFAGRFADRVLAVLHDGETRPKVAYPSLRRMGPVDDKAIHMNQPSPHEQAMVRGGHLGARLDEALAVDDDAQALVWVRNPHIASQDVIVTRGQLRAHGRALARALSRRMEGTRGRFVGVACASPIATVEAIVGVLFSGAAYVPLDIATPPVRLASMTERLRMRSDDAALILDDYLVASLVAEGLAEGASSNVDDDVHEGAGGDPAYAIFTSGSTGAPKGVVISHDAVMSQLQAREALGFPHVERSLLLAPFFFDGSIETLFWSLTTGGTLHLLDENSRRDPTIIRHTLATRRITYTSAVPALWSAVLDADDHSDQPLDDLAFVIVGGEKLVPSLIDAHHRHTRARLVNEYGPTETTVFATAWTANTPDTFDEVPPPYVPIGRSAPHVRCLVVDEQLEQVPVLEPGELIVMGAGLATGYLGAPDETARAFVTRDGERVYRTGDIVRLWPDGQLEWLARVDDQVKVRGVRVEPGEIEAALLAVGAKEAKVIVRDGALLAYVSPDTLDEPTLHTALHTRLPDVMVPQRIVALSHLPTTHNDKIDARALPAPQAMTKTPLATDTERTVAAVWSDVLGVEVNSALCSFVSCGGDSLRATLVARKLSARTGVPVALPDLLSARTVRGLAAFIDERGVNKSMAPPRLVIPFGDARGGNSVVFLPGIGGHVFTFAPIAQQMRASTFGLRTLGSEPGEPLHTSIVDLATQNLRALDEAGISDDLVLAGYSFGGLVAYEMALQRSVAGRPPSHLALFDTLAPGYPPRQSPWRRALMHAQALVRADWRGRRDYLRQRAHNVQERRMLEAAVAALGTPQLEALAPDQRAQLERLSQVSTLAHQAYRPRASLAVPLLLFVAEVPFAWAMPHMNDPHLGWRSWITAPTRRVTLRGDHLHLFDGDNQSMAAAHLDALAGHHDAR